MITYDDIMVAGTSIMSATMYTNQYNADKKDYDEKYPQWPGANMVFNVPNCIQNAAHSEDWSMVYCATRCVEWINYFILGCLLAFLLVLHCIMYKKVDRGCNLKILKRNRVQVLILSNILVWTLFIKLTFIFHDKFSGQIFIVLAQLLRFLIWTLTLINFMKSGMALVRSKTTKFTLKILYIFTYGGAIAMIAYGIFVIIRNSERNYGDDLLTCKNKDFLVQACVLLAVVSVFLVFSVRTSKLI